MRIHKTVIKDFFFLQLAVAELYVDFFSIWLLFLLYSKIGNYFEKAKYLIHVQLTETLKSMQPANKRNR